MTEPKLCEFCKERPVSTPRNRFCARSCSSRWRMTQPEIRARLYNPEVRAKIGASRSRWLASPQGAADRTRLGKLAPSTDPEVAAKISRTHRERGHKPSVRGGNGQGPTEPQRMLLEALGEGWETEHIVPTGKPRVAGGWPTHYKIDLACIEAMVAVEVDGMSHSSPKRRVADQRKDEFLRGLGWRVLRFSNQGVLSSLSTVMAEIRSLSTTSR